MKERSARNIVCSKTLVVKPERINDVLKLCQDVTTLSVEKAADKKAGIMVFDCVRDSWDTNVFHFWERYESVDSCNKHTTSPDVMKFMEKVQPHLEQPIGIAYYEWKSGQLGPSAVQIGPKGEGGLDDASGASGAAGGASMKQSSSTVDLTQIPEYGDEEENVIVEVQKTVTAQIDTFKGMFKKFLGLGGKE